MLEFRHLIFNPQTVGSWKCYYLFRFKHGSKNQRRFIYDALKNKVAVMAQEKYARNVILKLIKYGERDIKDYCIEHIGNVRKLVRSNIGQVKILWFSSNPDSVLVKFFKNSYSNFSECIRIRLQPVCSIETTKRNCFKIIRQKLDQTFKNRIWANSDISHWKKYGLLW